VRRTMLSASVLAVLLAGAAGGPAAAAEIHAGWTRADTGLQDRRDGLAVGVGSRAVLGPGLFHLVYSLDYVQKKGAQPALFADPVDGFVTDDAVVTLHALQPTLALEWRPGGVGLPRPYAGAAFAVKLSESWSEFPGTPNVAYGYREVDGVLLLGVAQQAGPLALDLRYGWGLTEQLLIDTSGTAELPGAKAGEPVPGAETPEVGAHVSYLQVGVRFAF
jgi:hypothetical protein